MRGLYSFYSNGNVEDILGEYAAYYRKSRADYEAEARGEGETLKRHEIIINKLAESMHIKIGGIYKEIVSGDSIEARPEVQALLEDVRRGRWKGVFVVEIERLARGNTIDQGIVAEAFKMSGTKIITPMKIYDPNNEFDEEYFEFGLFMSRREYKVINRRLQSGRVTSVGEGKYCGSIAPFGYDRVKIENDKGFTLTPNQEEDSVKMIFNTYAYNNISLNEVVRRLNNTDKKPRISQKWSISAIKDILRNPVYIGKIRWDSRKVVKVYKDGKVVKTRPRNMNHIVVDGLHKGIIDEQTWKIVQEKLSMHNPPVQHNSVVQNPLQGLVYCSKCGRIMQRRPYKSKGIPDTIMCPNMECNNVSSKLYIVEEKIIKSLREWLKEYRVDIDDCLEKIDCKKEKIIEQTISELKKELDNQNNKMKRIYDLLEDGTYSTEIFNERMRLISENINKIQEDIQMHEQELGIEVQKEIDKKTIIPKIENIIDLYPKLETAEEKNLLLKTIVKKVEYNKDKKALRKDSDPTDFELDIYPNVYHVG